MDLVGLRVPKDLKKILEGLARKEHRSLANFCFKCIVTCLKHHYNVDWKPEPPDEANKK